jgi:hypothetical protein
MGRRNGGEWEGGDKYRNAKVAGRSLALRVLIEWAGVWLR